MKPALFLTVLQRQSKGLFSSAEPILLFIYVWSLGLCPVASPNDEDKWPFIPVQNVLINFSVSFLSMKTNSPDPDLVK